MQSTKSKVIELLSQNNEQFISGQAISDQLNISRTAVWKHIKRLETEGFQLEAKPKLGYRIISYPNSINEYTLAHKLETNWLARKIVYRDTVTSTQDLAHKLAREGAEHGTVVIANEQTASKGRMNRKWYSAADDGIWMSIILRPKLFPYEAPRLTLLAAASIAETLTHTIKINPKIKWPNDLLLNGKKFCGILTEMHAEQDTIDYLVVGIGINVNQTKDKLPTKNNYEATSIYEESKVKNDIPTLFQAIVKSIEDFYELFITDGFTKIKTKWESFGYKIGQKVWVSTNTEKYYAVFVGIAEDGALLMQLENNEIKRVYSAEIDWFKEEN